MSQFENDDIDSFFAEMQDVKPIASDDKAVLHDPEKALAEKQKRAALKVSVRDKLANPLSMEGVKPVPPDDFIHYQQPGIQDGVFKKLRLGKYPLETNVTLSGKTLEQSRDLIYSTIKSVSYTHLRAHEDRQKSRMPSSA